MAQVGSFFRILTMRTDLLSIQWQWGTTSITKQVRAAHQVRLLCQGSELRGMQATESYSHMRKSLLHQRIRTNFAFPKTCTEVHHTSKWACLALARYTRALCRTIESTTRYWTTRWRPLRVEKVQWILMGIMMPTSHHCLIWLTKSGARTVDLSCHLQAQRLTKCPCWLRN